MELPKYVRALGGYLRFQRDIPTRLRALSETKTFTYPLGIKDTAIKEAELMRKRAEALDAFDLHCRMLENSDPAAFNANELDIAAMAVLRRLRTKAATLVTDEDGGAADSLLPEMADVVDKANKGEALTFKDKATARAYQKLTSKEEAKPRTLSQLWTEYAKDKRFNKDTREGKRQWQWWDKLIAVMGDAVIVKGSTHTLDHIHEGLDRYVQFRLSGIDVITGEQVAPVKGQSVKRELCQPMAALRQGSRRYRFGWLIEPPQIKNDAKSKKQSLLMEEQKLLLNYCLDSDAPKHAELAATALLLLQMGGMVSELARFSGADDELLRLNAEIPHLIVDAGKTTDRRRTVPIVVANEYISKHIATALKWIHSSSDSTHSYRLKQFLAAATGTEAGTYTAHSLRHTLRSNGGRVMADVMHLSEIAGWSHSGRMNSIMLDYGSASMDSSEMLKALQQTSLKIHAHLLPVAGAGNSNVVAIKSVKG
jgi:integrase